MEHGARFGLRLRNERERLGMSQDELAKAVGINRMSQGNYESGKRHPDARYMEAAIGVGFDPWYLLTGKRTGEEATHAAAAEYLVSELAKSLALRGDSFSGLWEKLIELLPTAVKTESVAGTSEDGRTTEENITTRVEDSPLTIVARDGIAEILASSPMVIDESLLERVLIELDGSIDRHGAKLSAKQRAQIAIMTYRQSRISGLVSQSMVDELVSLAKS